MSKALIGKFGVILDGSADRDGMRVSSRVITAVEQKSGWGIPNERKVGVEARDERE